LPGPLAVNLHLEIIDPSLAIQAPGDAFPVRRVHIPLAAEVGGSGDQARLGIETVQAHQGRVGAHQPARRGGTINTLARVIENIPVFGLGAPLVGHVQHHRQRSFNIALLVHFRHGRQQYIDNLAAGLDYLIGNIATHTGAKELRQYLFQRIFAGRLGQKVGGWAPQHLLFGIPQALQPKTADRQQPACPVDGMQHHRRLVVQLTKSPLAARQGPLLVGPLQLRRRAGRENPQQVLGQGGIGERAPVQRRDDANPATVGIDQRCPYVGADGFVRQHSVIGKQFGDPVRIHAGLMAQHILAGTVVQIVMKVLEQIAIPVHGHGLHPARVGLVQPANHGQVTAQRLGQIPHQGFEKRRAGVADGAQGHGTQRLLELLAPGNIDDRAQHAVGVARFIPAGDTAIENPGAAARAVENPDFHLQDFGFSLQMAHQGLLVGRAVLGVNLFEQPTRGQRLLVGIDIKDVEKAR